jgi:putative adhesin
MRTIGIAFCRLVLATACVTMGTEATAQQAPERVTVTFSDPSKPGIVKVHVMMGGITVKGMNRKDVTVETKPSARGDGRGGRGRGPTVSYRQDEAPAGLRRLTQPGGFSLEEENNELTISSPFGRSIDFEIQVPVRTNLKLSAVNGGDVVVDGVEGEVEVNNVNGPIALTNIAGSVVAHSVNGSVKATLTRVTPDKAMAFASMNGNIDVTLPSSLKANLKLQSDRGDVFTDFDVQVRPATPTPVEDQRKGGGRFRIDVNKAIYGTINGGGQEFELRTFNGNVYLRKGT